MKKFDDKQKLVLKQQVKSQLGSFAPIKELADSDSIEYAGALYATAKDTVEFDPALIALLPIVPPIEGKQPLAAAAELNRWWKNYRKTGDTPATWYNDTITKTPIIVNRSGLEVNGKAVEMHGGVPGLKADLVPHRVAADALILYTSCPQTRKEKQVSLNVNSASAEMAGFPLPNLFAERLSIENGLDMGDTMIARDAMVNKLAADIPGMVSSFNIQHKLYSMKESLSGSENDDVTVFYNKYCNRIGKKPVAGKIKVWQRQSVEITYPTDLHNIWAYHVASMSCRGSYKGRGGVTVGYYRGDLPHHVIRNIDIVTDIMMVCKGFGVKIVEVGDEPEVIKILIANGYKVINPKYGKILCHGSSKPGLYSACSVTHVSFKLPTLEAVVAPPRSDFVLPKPYVFPPFNIIGKKQYIYYACRDYIREGFADSYPSVAAADGVCIRTSAKMPYLQSVDYIPLMRRFSMAISYRNAFFMTRLLFSPMDVYRGYFESFTIPKIIADNPVLKFDGISTVVPVTGLIKYDSILEPVEMEKALVGDVDVPSLSATYLTKIKESGEGEDSVHFWLILIKMIEFSSMPEILKFVPLPEALISFLVTLTFPEWNILIAEFLPNGVTEVEYNEKIVPVVTQAQDSMSVQEEQDGNQPSAAVPQAADEEEDIASMSLLLGNVAKSNATIRVEKQ